MQTYRKNKTLEVILPMFSTNYLTACGNSSGVIEVHYLPFDIPVITSAWLRNPITNQNRNIRKRIKGKLEADLLRDIEIYERLVEESMREAYGDDEEVQVELTNFYN